MEEYTCEEIEKEMAVLKNSFAIVRLVDPVKCQIVELKREGDSLILSPADTCYDVWEKTGQCTNCTSARAFQEKKKQTKCELCEEQPYFVTARPLIVSKTPLVLEIVQPVSYSCNGCEDSIPELSALIRSLNLKTLIDPETHAFSQTYLKEHLPNIIADAASRPANAALVRLISYDRILKDFGPVAASGAICQLYDLLQAKLTSLGEAPVLVRFDKNTFFVIDQNLEPDSFLQFLQALQSPDIPPHLLFQSSQLPFELKAAGISITKEQHNKTTSLISLLESRLNNI